MSWAGPGFVIAIIAISTFGWVATSWIRARHGYPLEGEWGGTVAKTDLEQSRKVQLLESENGKLQGQISRLEERIAILERIATDPAERTAREIDALR
ncbi:hypothetical protein HJG53_04050 [Sphingomonas sp. ID1715]|uniref:hypothetical protein n=1 Tax=Sphingomonas sp. ID1715 TaxID=1656898 RepID=UPI001489185D|nr:hypothetical protein [Sphingomonas sp. ID1715]NNM76080.1 hypothetical protein [Sphingomonas sp. ID1715]